jgi:hypothetical protein
MGDYALEGPQRGEGTHMEFIEHVILRRKAEPSPIFPREGGVQDLRGAVHPQRLETGGWVGTFEPAVEPV